MTSRGVLKFLVIALFSGSFAGCGASGASSPDETTIGAATQALSTRWAFIPWQGPGGQAYWRTGTHKIPPLEPCPSSGLVFDCVNDAQRIPAISDFFSQTADYAYVACVSGFCPDNLTEQQAWMSTVARSIQPLLDPFWPHIIGIDLVEFDVTGSISPGYGDMTMVISMPAAYPHDFIGRITLVDNGGNGQTVSLVTTGNPLTQKNWTKEDLVNPTEFQLSAELGQPSFLHMGGIFVHEWSMQLRFSSDI
jgi:hypothetical protein